MYKIELKQNEKIFLVTFSGLIPKEESDKCYAELVEKLKTFNTSQYYLIIDALDLKTGPQETNSNQKNTVELFATTQFKGRYNILPRSVTANSQAKRVVGDDALSKIIPVKSYEEALKLFQ